MFAGKIFIAFENNDYNLKLPGKAKRVENMVKLMYAGKPIYKMQLIE